MRELTKEEIQKVDQGAWAETHHRQNIKSFRHRSQTQKDDEKTNESHNDE